jgi:acetone carboxylase gamma subunit
VDGSGRSSFSRRAKRYEVQFQDDCQRHSDTNDVEQAKYFAQSLANWNLAAQVYDRATQQIISRSAHIASNEESTWLEIRETNRSTPRKENYEKHSDCE